MFRSINKQLEGLERPVSRSSRGGHIPSFPPPGRGRHTIRDKNERKKEKGKKIGKKSNFCYQQYYVLRIFSPNQREIECFLKLIIW